MKTKLGMLRKAKGLSQTRLSIDADVSLRMIQSYEVKRRDINKAQAITVYKLAQALGCKVEDLLELEETDG